jgi:uncharacterized protein (TIGR04255 family)
MSPSRRVASEDRPVSFARPPVDEVYIGFQTREPSFPADNFGELVEIYGTEFPKLNAQPKLDRDAEREEVGPARVQVELISNLGQRFWLLSADDTRVLQIQDDRIIYNWRKRGQEGYPRFDTIRDEFTTALDKLVRARNLNATELIDFCEVSYTNHIELPDGSDPRSQLHRVFKHVSSIDIVADDLSLEETSFNVLTASLRGG